MARRCESLRRFMRRSNKCRVIFVHRSVVCMSGVSAHLAQPLRKRGVRGSHCLPREGQRGACSCHRGGDRGFREATDSLWDNRQLSTFNVVFNMLQVNVLSRHPRGCRRLQWAPEGSTREKSTRTRNRRYRHCTRRRRVKIEVVVKKWRSTVVVTAHLEAA